MAAASEMLSTAEAAVVSRVALRDVNRVIDERILPESLVSHGDGRRISAGASALIAFYWAEPRLRDWQRHMSAELLSFDWIVSHDFLKIDLRPFLERSIGRLERLMAARELVCTSADVMGGVPVVRGTRIPVYDVASAKAAGASDKELLEDYPSLTPETLELAILYAEANPRRGRPRPLATALPEGTRQLSVRHARRR
ncbi:MAG: hypothetical protein B7Z29_16655 [Hyphomicrobium sp. 12-62-95]|nr:MAG: hypothetical protein B7Z29_16655 [Hyphomicrobium sp. 12-62-95]